MAESTSPQSPPAHAALATVFQVRDDELQVLLWKRAREPFRGDWSLPGGSLGPGETLEESILRHLAAKVDVREVAHLEQLGTWSDPVAPSRALGARDRVPRPRPARNRPARANGHTLAPCGHAAGRRHSITGRSSSRDESGSAASSRTRTSASRSPRRRSRSRSYATSTPPPSGTTSPRPTSSASCSAGERSRRRASVGHTAPRAGGRRRSSASGRSRLEVTDPFAVLRPPGVETFRSSRSWRHSSVLPRRVRRAAHSRSGGSASDL